MTVMFFAKNQKAAQPGKQTGKNRGNRSVPQNAFRHISPFSILAIIRR